MKPQFTLQLPKYSLLEKSNLDTCSCERCGRAIKNAYTIKNNETKEVGVYGSGCAQVMMEGKSITEMARENEAYTKAYALYEDEMVRYNDGKLNVTTFEEVHPEMLQYIAEGASENSFLADMKSKIELSGSLTDNQFAAVERMMLPWAELEPKVKDLVVRPIAMSIRAGYFDGWEYTVTALNDKNEKVRIFFSSLNEQKEQVLIKSGILGIDRDGYITYNVKIDEAKEIKLSGSYDGYKVKRAKVAL